MENWKETRICRKNRCQFSHKTNCCWGMPLHIFCCLLLKWNL